MEKKYKKKMKKYKALEFTKQKSLTALAVRLVGHRREAEAKKINSLA